VRVPAIEPRLVKSIRRGHTPIEHRLDLHGRTQAQAHRQLEQTLSAARARGQKLVLVVTGTGLRRRLEGLGDGLDPRPADGSEPGVLRRNLSHWLSQPPMGDWVLGLSPAGPEHGGAGAFYLLLRRAR
jgi:DNA-nicking Smr family endonuclease